MARHLALAAIGLSSVLILVLCLLGGGAAELGFAVLAMALPVALMLLGVVRPDGRMGSAGGPILLLLALLESCLLGMLLFRGQVAVGPWLLGLPAAASIQIYGIFLVPLALVALGYALTFGDVAVSDDDLERLRRASERVSSNPGDED